jgi:hypothetical protein
MINFSSKFHVAKLNKSLDIIIKTKTKDIFLTTTTLFCKITFTNYHTLSRCYSKSFENHEISVAVNLQVRPTKRILLLT